MPFLGSVRQLLPPRKMTEVRFRMEKQKSAIENKEANKTVSLGTSKVNYMDPRITVAWCKKATWAALLLTTRTGTTACRFPSICPGGPLHREGLSEDHPNEVPVGDAFSVFLLL